MSPWMIFRSEKPSILQIRVTSFNQINTHFILHHEISAPNLHLFLDLWQPMSFFSILNTMQCFPNSYLQVNSLACKFYFTLENSSYLVYKSHVENLKSVKTSPPKCTWPFYNHLTARETLLLSWVWIYFWINLPYFLNNWSCNHIKSSI